MNSSANLLGTQSSLSVEEDLNCTSELGGKSGNRALSVPLDSDDSVV